MLRHKFSHVLRDNGGGKPFEQKFQLGLGLNLVGLGCGLFPQGIRSNAGASTLGGVPAKSQFYTQGHGTDGVLNRVVVGREQAAAHEAQGLAPLDAGVGHGLAEKALGRDVGDTLIEDGPNRLQDGNGLFTMQRNLFLWR